MSNFLSAILVWEKNSLRLKEYLKAQKITNGYVRNASESVIAMNCKNINKIGESLALKISAGLNTRTLYLIHNEDYGWGINGYIAGEPKGEYHLEYGSPRGEAPIDGWLNSFADNTTGLLKLKECIESNNEELIFKESWKLLVQLLGIDISDDYNFDTLQGMPQGYLLLGGNEPITEKKSSLKKTLSEHLEPLLLERGYLPNTETTLPCDFAYFKKVEDFYVGLMIHKETNSVVPYLKTIFEDVPIFGTMRRYYKTNIELIKILDEIVNEFDNSLVIYINDLYFEPFDDSRELFMNLLHDFLIEHDYYVAVNSIEKLAGGEIFYKNKKSSNEISFVHSLYYLGLTCIYTENGCTKVIYAKDEDDNIVPRIIRNRDDYVRLLTLYKKELR